MADRKARVVIERTERITFELDVDGESEVNALRTLRPQTLLASKPSFRYSSSDKTETIEVKAIEVVLLPLTADERDEAIGQIGGGS